MVLVALYGGGGGFADILKLQEALSSEHQLVLAGHHDLVLRHAGPFRNDCHTTKREASTPCPTCVIE